MPLSPSHRDRLPGILVVLVLHAGLVALLVLSLEFVRRAPQEKETILTLAPLPRPVFRPAMVIDGRARPPLRPSTVPPAITPFYVPPVPQIAAPSNGGFLLQDLGKSLADCRQEKYSDLSPSRAICPPLAAQAKNDDRDLLARPQVKDEARWQVGLARKNAPAVLPGGDIFGTLLTLFTNPSAFGDKRNYSYASQEPTTSAVGARQLAADSKVCPNLGGSIADLCGSDAAAPYRHGFALYSVAADHPHVTEVAFQQALESANERKRALYGRPDPAEAPAEGAP